MLLRRFARHMRQQDWFAVALDVVVVVIGIYIGLQVNNFNEARKDRKEERAFMARLLQDAEYNEQQITAIIAQHKRRAVKAKQALDVLIDPTKHYDDPEQSMFHMLLSVDIASVRLSTGTYDELISSGKMGLLKDIELKKRIQNEAGIHLFTQGSLENFRSLATNPIPYSLKYTRFHPGENEFGMLPQSYDFDAMRNDTEFVGAVQNSIGAVLSFVEFRRNQLAAVQNVKVYLQCKLHNKQCDKVDNL